MAKTQTTVRINEEEFNKAKEVLRIIGLNYSQAINMFNSMIVLTQGLPFDAKIPNNTTMTAMKEAKKMNGDFISLKELSRT